MCKVIDAAYTMIDHGIALAEQTGDKNYYVDFYKLHKLLFYAQAYMLAVYDEPLFDEPIEAHNCGPFIPELLTLPMGGFDPIEESNFFYLPLTEARIDAIDTALSIYGKYPSNDLINISKRVPEYLYAFSSGNEHTQITKQQLKAIGQRAFALAPA